MEITAVQMLFVAVCSLTFGFGLGWMLKGLFRKHEIREIDHRWAINLQAMKCELTRSYRPLIKQAITR